MQTPGGRSQSPVRRTHVQSTPHPPLQPLDDPSYEHTLRISTPDDRVTVHATTIRAILRGLARVAAHLPSQSTTTCRPRRHGRGRPPRALPAPPKHPPNPQPPHNRHFYAMISFMYNAINRSPPGLAHPRSRPDLSLRQNRSVVGRSCSREVGVSWYGVSPGWARPVPPSARIISTHHVNDQPRT